MLHLKEIIVITFLIGGSLCYAAFLYFLSAKLLSANNDSYRSAFFVSLVSSIVLPALIFFLYLFDFVSVYKIIVVVVIANILICSIFFDATLIESIFIVILASILAVIFNVLFSTLINYMVGPEKLASFFEYIMSLIENSWLFQLVIDNKVTIEDSSQGLIISIPTVEQSKYW